MLVSLDGAWTFDEGPLDRPPALDGQVLAAVRDEDSWSWLAPADPDASRLSPCSPSTSQRTRTTAASSGGWPPSSSATWAPACSSSAARTAAEEAYPWVAQWIAVLE